MHWRQVSARREPLLISLAYYELYLAVSRTIQSFELRPRSPVGQNSTAFHPVSLPPRREWVAAVPTVHLEVTARRRAT